MTKDKNRIFKTVLSTKISMLSGWRETETDNFTLTWIFKYNLKYNLRQSN